MRTFRLFQYVITLLLLAGMTSCRDAGNSETREVPSDSLMVEEMAEPAFDPEDEMFGLSEPRIGDLEGMIERGQIRALVPYNRTYYYSDGRHRRGIAYEALRLFEKDLNRQLS